MRDLGAQGVVPPVVAALPTSSGTGGMVRLSTDNELYEDRGGAWRRVRDMLRSVYDSNNDGRIDPAALGTGLALNNTFLRGDGAFGSIGGNGLYAVALQESAALRVGGFNRSTAALSSGGLRVMWLGDSVTEDGNLVSQEDNHPQRIQRWLEKRFGTSTMVFANYSLGGRRIDDLNNSSFLGSATEPTDITASFGPRQTGDRPWIVVGKSWMQHVKDFAPDLVILMMGMNYNGELDSGYRQSVQFNSVIATLRAFPVRPDILIVTPMLSTANNAVTYQRRQDIARSIIRAIRVVAYNNAIPVADAGRLSWILRNGFDDVARVARYEYNWGGLGLPGWTGATASWTQSADGSTLTRVAEGTAGYINRASNYIDGEMRLSAQFTATTNTQMVRLYFRQADIGYLMVQWIGWSVTLYEADPNGTLTALGGGEKVTNATPGTPDGAYHTLRVVSRQDRHEVYVDNVLYITANSIRNLHEGNVSMGMDQGTAGYALPVAIKNFQHVIRDPISASPIYSELDLIGPLNPGPTDSGNGLNHPTALGVWVMYYAALQAALTNILEPSVYGSVTTKTTSSALSITDVTTLADATTGPITLTLPTAVGCAGQSHTVKKIDASGNAVTVATTSSQTIDGATTAALSARYIALTVVSDGSNWQVV